MAKLGYAKREERATALAKRFINQGWTPADAARVACIQYDLNPHYIIGNVEAYASNLDDYADRAAVLETKLSHREADEFGCKGF
jgi:hypothetical protein